MKSKAEQLLAQVPQVDPSFDSLVKSLLPEENSEEVLEHTEKNLFISKIKDTFKKQNELLIEALFKTYQSSNEQSIRQFLEDLKSYQELTIQLTDDTKNTPGLLRTLLFEKWPKLERQGKQLFKKDPLIWTGCASIALGLPVLALGVGISMFLNPAYASIALAGLFLILGGYIIVDFGTKNPVRTLRPEYFFYNKPDNLQKKAPQDENNLSSAENTDSKITNNI